VKTTYTEEAIADIVEALTSAILASC